VQQYDWSTVTARIVEVYETVVAVDTALAVDVDHAVDAFADELPDDDDDPGRLSSALRRWLSRAT
jgi:hypothetical protein